MAVKLPAVQSTDTPISSTFIAAICLYCKFLCVVWQAPQRVTAKPLAPTSVKPGLTMLDFTWQMPAGCGRPARRSCPNGGL